MSSTSYRPFILSLILLLSISTLPALAQVTGSIAGTVRDSSGAVLPGATVTVRGPSLQRENVTVTTNADGTYRLVLVPPGTYSVGVWHAKLKSVPKPVTVDGTKPAVVDFVLGR